MLGGQRLCVLGEEGGGEERAEESLLGERSQRLPCQGPGLEGRCSSMNVALLQSRGRVPISAGEPMLFCQILNQEPCCFLARDSLTYLAIARHWHPQPGWAVGREGPRKKSGGDLVQILGKTPREQVGVVFESSRRGR